MIQRNKNHNNANNYSHRSKFHLSNYVPT